MAILLFTQALQPTEISWLRWCDFDSTANVLQVVRNRYSTINNQLQVVNRQKLCQAEVDTLIALQELRTTDWLFESERQQRLSERTLHHIIARAGIEASLPFPVHPYMLRRTGLYYRAALLLEPVGLTLGECCLLWNWYATSIPFSMEQLTQYRDINRKREEGFLMAMEQMKAFTGITSYDNVVDYLLGAFSLFPQMKNLPQHYWLAPVGWHQKPLPTTTSRVLKSALPHSPSQRLKLFE